MISGHAWLTTKSAVNLSLLVPYQFLGETIGLSSVSLKKLNPVIIHNVLGLIL
jgi:hypothetical protein